MRMGKIFTCAVSFRFLLLLMRIVLRITLPITAVKGQVVKAVPWIRTASGNLGIRSASLYQVGGAWVCVRNSKFTQLCFFKQICDLLGLNWNK